MSTGCIDLQYAALIVTAVDTTVMLARVARQALKIERVSLERCGPGRNSSANLDSEHRSVDTQDNPQDPTLGPVAALPIIIVALITAIRVHTR
jgi:hypothetical protein